MKGLIDQFLKLPYFLKYCSSQSTNAFNLFSSPKRSVLKYWWGLVNIPQRPVTKGATVSLFVSPIVLSRRDKMFFRSLRNFHSYSSNRRNSICFMMFAWKRTSKKLWESFAHLFGFWTISNRTVCFTNCLISTR